MTVTFVRGASGSGKSTFVKRNFKNIFHLENDYFFYKDGKYEWNGKLIPNAIKWVENSLRVALANGMDVVISNTFVLKSHLDPLVNLAKSRGAKVDIFRMVGSFKNAHDVPEEIVQSMKNRMEDYEGEILVTPEDGGYVFSAF